MSLFTDNIGIKKIIAHLIPKGNGNNNELVLSSTCIQNDPKIDTELKERITQLLSYKSLDFAFGPSQNSTFDIIRSAICEPDENTFVDLSQKIARKLNEASTNARIPNCLMLVIQATTSVASTKQNALFILRAEPQTGFKKVFNNSTINLEFVNELFLSKSQKMLKIAAIITPLETPSNLVINRAERCFKCRIYDENYEIGSISSTAKYFSEKFLGCAIPDDAKNQTQLFYRKTLEFINRSAMSDYDKIKAKNGLVAALESASENVDFNDYARSYLPANLHADYVDNLSALFADNSTTISKDISLIDKDIKKNCIVFDNGISLRFPENDGQILSITDDPEHEGTTIIKISARIKKLS